MALTQAQRVSSVEHRQKLHAVAIVAALPLRTVRNDTDRKDTVRTHMRDLVSVDASGMLKVWSDPYITHGSV